MAAEPRVSLDIGGLGYDLVCNNGILADWLRTRCRHFPPQSMKRLIAHLTIEPDEQTLSLLEQPPRFSQGALSWDAPGVQGWIDPFQAAGRLALASRQPQAEAEYFLRAACALFSFENGGLLFHAAGVVQHGKAYLFFGRSGSGKSTVASFSPVGAVLNDDLVLLMPHQGIWWAYPTPFWNQPISPAPAPPAPLAGVYRLVQDRKVFLAGMSRGIAISEMISNAPLVSADANRSHQLIQRGQDILTTVPAFFLHFQPDDSFWQVVSPTI